MMSTLSEAIERRLASRASLYLVVQEDDETGLLLSGMVGSEELREAALDIARELAGAVAVVDDIEVVDVIPDEIADVPADARGERGFARLQRAPTGVSLEPGDFAGQRLIGSADEASGPERSLESDAVAEGDDADGDPGVSEHPGGVEAGEPGEIGPVGGEEDLGRATVSAAIPSERSGLHVTRPRCLRWCRPRGRGR